MDSVTLSALAALLVVARRLIAAGVELGKANWVNFSGVYKGLGGGLLVTDYSATPGTPGVTNKVNGESIAVADGLKTKFSGKLKHASFVRGSVSITVAGYLTLTDDGTGVLGGGGADGTIEYGTGAWSIDLKGTAPDSGTAITASYQYTVAGNAGTGSAGSGSSGIKVYSFTVFQEGNVMTITDNNGSVYEGNFGSIRSSAGATEPASGATVVGRSECNGVSGWLPVPSRRAGVVGGDGDVLGNRQMFGVD